MRRNPGVLPALLLLIATAACAGAGGRYYSTARPGSGVAMEAAPATSSAAVDARELDGPRLAGFDDTFGDGTVYRTGGEGDDFEPVPADRKLIYQGEVAVEVPQPEPAIAAFLAKVADQGGYMQSQVGNTVTVRVPADRFDAAFESVKRAGRVLREERRAQDVTEEFVDLEIRLGNARKSRERLLAILERAEKVEDILKIEEQLRRLTDDIETMEGRRKYLADQVAYATLTAEFRAVTEPPPDKRRRRPSRFPWINLVGAERVMEDF